jgi:hypothetical protein
MMNLVPWLLNPNHPLQIDCVLQRVGTFVALLRLVHLVDPASVREMQIRTRVRVSCINSTLKYAHTLQFSRFRLLEISSFARH